MPGSDGLKIPEPHEIGAVQQLLMRCKSPRVQASDLPNWEEVLMDSGKSPLSVMQVERQQRSDCQGNATANGEEFRTWYCNGRQTMPMLSEIYAYNASEYLMNARQVGRDQGTSIHSGVRVLVDGIPGLGIAPGLPTEAVWPYSRYCRSATEFQRYCNGLEIQSSHVVEVIEPPPFRDMLAQAAAGATLHMGTYWGPSYTGQLYDGKKLVKRFPGPGNGGHATEGIWGKRFNAVGWLLAVWNSHGDGWYWVDENEYERQRQNKFAPFEAYVLRPDNVVERYHDRVKSGGGYV